ncbi:MAG: PAS domain S-box protein, partial [Bacteroidales bacterium]|nr:PAS domain S-box protein [Bacteroidales bacterium]
EDEIELPGGKQWFLSTFSTVKNAKGEINGVQILSNNITDRKNIESQLRKNQQRLEEAQAVAHVGGWEWNLKTNESWWSKELLSIYGLKPEDDVPGIETWTEHIYKEDLEFLLKSIDDSLSSKKPYDVKYRIIRHDNQAIRWIHAKAKVIHDANNKPVTMYGTARDITKEKEAIEQLSKSEARYRHLVETASDAIYLIDDKGIIIDTNQIATRMLQKSKPEIVGSKIDTVDPNFPTEAFLNFWKQVPAGEQRIFETTHITKTGIRIPIEISGKKFIIDEKTFYFGIARDLTERKKAICALAESEEKFRSIFSCANIGISIADGKGDQIDVNDEFLRKLKYTKEEYLELNFTDFSHPDDNEKEISFIREINEGKRNNYRISKRLRKKDGEFLWFDISVTALRNDQGKVEMFFAMSIDITDQKNAIEEKSILGDMLDTAPNSITVHDEAGHFLYANQKTFKLHGYLPEEYMTLNLKEIDVPESAELIEKRIQTIKENGYGVFEVEHFRKDGSRIPLEVYVKKVSWKGNPALLSIATDISERNKWIKELVNAKEKAEEANRLKTEFLNNMSHEIRTPMNGIIGFSEMLDKEDITHEKRKYYSRIVQNSSYQLLRIIDDILEISTLETKQQKPIESEFCLNDLIMELFSIFNLKARERDVPVYIKKELPDNKSYIISDKSKLNKILSNLLENALKFTNEGFIEIGYFLKRKNLVLYVKDTGIGVSPQNQEIIFERFSQEDKEISRKHGGLGLGLSISKENAKLLGGDITVESEKGKGSIFYVTIPYRKAQKTDLNSTHTSSGVDKETNTDETLTILVAEDEEVNYLYIEALFEEITDKNITLIHAINGKEAVNLCNENNINLILMDIKMPVMGGLEATEKIKAKFPQLPIIAQTAYSTEADKQLAMKHGCNDFISKPINKEILFNMINNYVNVK